MTLPTTAERHAKIEILIKSLEGPRADYTPAELFRFAKFVPGWSITAAQLRRPGTYEVEGVGVGTRIVDSDALVRLLQTHWIEQAKAELSKAAP